MKLAFNGIILAVSLVMSATALAQKQIRAEITAVSNDGISLADGSEYKVVKQRTHKHKKTVVVARGNEIDFSNLLGVGYVDDALLTVDGKTVTRIEVIRLDQ